MEMNEEVKKAAQKLSEVIEKAVNNVAKDKLIKTLFELGSESIQSKLPELSKSDKIILKDALEEMTKGMAIDKDYAAKYVQGKVYSDTVIQEDKADDDADEKLVKPENAKVNHQGDQSPKGRDENKVEDPKVKKGYTTSTDMHDSVAKGCAMKNVASQIHKDGHSRGYAQGYGMAKGYDAKEFEKAITEVYGDQNYEIKKGDAVSKNPEENQSKDDLEKLQSKKDRGNKERPEALKVEKENKAAQDKVDDIEQKGTMKKALVWDNPNALLKCNIGGRNHHFSINEFYDQAIKTVLDYKTGDLKKSEDPSVNGLIERGEDRSANEVLVKSELSKQNPDGVNLVKSFDIADMANALNISEKDQKDILGT